MLHATLRFVIHLIVLINDTLNVSADLRLIPAETFDNRAICGKKSAKYRSMRLRFVLHERIDARSEHSPANFYQQIWNRYTDASGSGESISYSYFIIALFTELKILLIDARRDTNISNGKSFII